MIRTDKQRVTIYHGYIDGINNQTSNQTNNLINKQTKNGMKGKKRVRHQ